MRLPSRRVALSLDEYRILPQSVSVPAGRIRITAVNRGILTHNVTIELQRRDSNGHPVILADTSTIMPGATGTVVTPALRPGRYALLSTVSNQADLGMTATLVVRR